MGPMGPMGRPAVGRLQVRMGGGANVSYGRTLENHALLLDRVLRRELSSDGKHLSWNSEIFYAIGIIPHIYACFLSGRRVIS